MKKLRLLVTQECNRTCDGCCNKQFNLNNLPTITNPDHYNQYDIIMITGGEPMLFSNKIYHFIKTLKTQLKYKGKIILYTAKIDNLLAMSKLLLYLDGITITLHNQYDVRDFLSLDSFLFIVRLFDIFVCFLSHFSSKSILLIFFLKIFLTPSGV